MVRSFRQQYEEWGIDNVLRTYPGLSIRPHSGSGVVIAGDLAFRACFDGHEEIIDSYDIQISVPDGFPRELPTAKALGGRIPRNFHTDPDKSLCLGSPIRLRMAIGDCRTVPKFIEKCLVPFLYGYSYKERHGVLPFGELAHGQKGIIDDYRGLFHLDNKNACIEMVGLAAMKKRSANKKPCPCGSGRRVGKCHNRVINRLRRRLGRLFFRAECARLKR